MKDDICLKSIMIEYHANAIKLHRDMINKINNCSETTAQKIESKPEHAKEKNIQKHIDELEQMNNDNDSVLSRMAKARQSQGCSKPCDKSEICADIGRKNNINTGEVEIPNWFTPNEEPNEGYSPHKSNVKYPVLSRLSKFTQKKQNEIIRNIFKTSSKNIDYLIELDTSLENDRDDLIGEEADRLLEAYLADF
jgi:hypothetical protein